MQTAESSADACPLDERQQRRILDGVLAGPVVELLSEVVRRLPTGPRRAADAAAYQLAVERRLRPMELDIPLRDDTGRAGFAWPGTALTGDDRRRLATMGNTTQLSATRLLHHSVRVAHHLFQTIMLEIMATSEQTGMSVRDLLLNATSGNGHPGRIDNQRPRADATGQVDCGAPGVELSASLDSSAIADAEVAPVDHAGPPTVEPNVADCIALSFPPQPMAKRAAATPARENVTEERIEELEDRIDRLQETMQVLIDAIDGLRVDLVHTLRNLPDRLPAPLHIHSLPLDPTASDFGERMNAIPPEVMDRLRAEVAGARRGESAPAAAAAEGNPVPAAVVDESQGNGHRGPGRQGTLFG